MPIIREFRPQDAQAVSELVQLTMAASSVADYPLERLQPLIDYFNPDKIAQLGQERFCLVAEADDQIIGTAALEGEHIWTFFVHPFSQRLGIGARLLAALEDAAVGRGLKRLLVEASLGGTSFYERHGYRRTGKVIEGVAGPQIEVQKMVSQ